MGWDEASQDSSTRQHCVILVIEESRDQATCSKKWALATGSIGPSPRVRYLQPLPQQTTARSPLGFVAIGPLLWAALRHNQRDTATVALMLSAFAIWGTCGPEDRLCGRN